MGLAGIFSRCIFLVGAVFTFIIQLVASCRTQVDLFPAAPQSSTATGRMSLIKQESRFWSFYTFLFVIASTTEFIISSISQLLIIFIYTQCSYTKSTFWRPTCQHTTPNPFISSQKATITHSLRSRLPYLPRIRIFSFFQSKKHFPSPARFRDLERGS